MLSRLFHYRRLPASPREEKAPLPPPALRIVLDIDETLGTRLFHPLYAPLQTTQHHLTHQGETHHLHFYYYHGAVEFIRFLHQLPNTTIVFFSSAVAAANQCFVDELYKQAFGAGFTRPTIYSRDRLATIAYDQPIKDLKLTLQNPEDSLAHTVLIDDNHNITTPDQKAHQLCTNAVSPSDYARCETEADIFLCNQLFYLTGLIKAALAQTTTSFADSLQSLHQAAQKDNRNKIKSGYIVDGLMELRCFNAGLALFTGEAKLQELHLPYLKKALSISPGNGCSCWPFWRSRTHAVRETETMEMTATNHYRLDTP